MFFFLDVLVEAFPKVTRRLKAKKKKQKKKKKAKEKSTQKTQKHEIVYLLFISIVVFI